MSECHRPDQHGTPCVRETGHVGTHQGHIRYVIHPDERAREIVALRWAHEPPKPGS